MNKREIRSWKKVLVTDLNYIAYELKEQINKPALVILDGPLGAGKTTFAKVFVTDGDTLSPTYSILSESHDVLHADLYRVKSRDEIIYLELELYLEGKIYFLVEWGKDHFSSLIKEIPEDFSYYLLSIVIDENSTNDENATRTFTLYEVEEE